MPELPEVEVTRRRLERELVGCRFKRVVLRVRKLRLPLPDELSRVLPGLEVRGIDRRGKYLLFDCGKGCLLVHLGMTGFLRLLRGTPPPGKHDHLDFVFDGGLLLRFHDPRKFGTVAWVTGDPLQHPLLAGIGPEPLTAAFDGEYLFSASRGRKVAVKQLVMNSAVVAGVGNIYANEALFRARIRPDRAAGTLTSGECTVLAATIRTVLRRLEEKGYLAHATENRTFFYRPAASRQAVAGRAVQRIVDWFCEGSVETLLAGMVDSAVLDRQELQRLAERIAASKQGKKHER